MLYIPIFAMIAVTFTALGLTIYQLSSKLILAISMDIFGDSLQLVFAVLILGLGVFVAIQGTKKLFVRKQENRPSGGKKAEEPVQV